MTSTRFSDPFHGKSMTVKIVRVQQSKPHSEILLLVKNNYGAHLKKDPK